MYSAASMDAMGPPASDADGRQIQLADALAELARRTRFPVVFGGFVHDDRVEISRLIGNHRDTLRGLVVRSGWGLGGRALQEARPRFTSDYRSSRVITHDYDRPVLAEGITSLLAVPVVVGRTTRAVLYGGLRSPAAVGGVTIDPAVAVAEGLGARLAQSDRTAGARNLSSEHREELRRVYAELRRIAADVPDTGVRARLEAVEQRIARVAHEGPAGPGAGIDPGLTAREIDVLSLAALGRRNADIGRTIGVTEATVKSYMHAAMRKLDASTRHEAVAAARARRLLP